MNTLKLFAVCLCLALVAVAAAEYGALRATDTVSAQEQVPTWDGQKWVYKAFRVKKTDLKVLTGTMKLTGGWAAPDLDAGNLITYMSDEGYDFVTMTDDLAIFRKPAAR